MKKVGMLAFFLAAIVFSGCVSTQKYEQDVGALKQKLDASEQEKGQLKQDYESMNASLKSENEALGNEKTRLERGLSEKELLISKLKSEVASGKITISELEDKLTVRFVESLFFRSGSATLTGEGKSILNSVAEALAAIPQKQISVEGHTDNKPIGPKLKDRYASNWELSAARAITVARYLAERTGISPERIAATGYGSHHPVTSNETREGRAENRRVEIMLAPQERKVVPLEGQQRSGEGPVM